MVSFIYVRRFFTTHIYFFSASVTIVSSTAISSECLSLHLSKSASQVSLGALKSQSLLPSFRPEPGQPYPYPRPFHCPDHCHPNVLWTLNDCKNDPSVTTSDTNKSRPSMRCVIRHEDGTHISDEEWKTIHQSATIIAHSILGPLDPQGLLAAAGQLCKKSFFKHHFLSEWIWAMNELEAVAPLTSFCAGTWKADLTLGSILDVLSSRSAPPSQTAPPSRSSLTPSSVIPSSNMAPPSTVPSHAGSSHARSSRARSSRAPSISHSAGIASASHTSHWSPRRTAPKSLQMCAPSESQRADSVPLSLAASKGKHRRDPSLVPLREEKWTKGCMDVHSSTSPGT
jgi:hypothetical protein